MLTVALAARGQSDRTYVGTAQCATCHAGIHRQSAHSLHSRVFQLATSASVQGDFTKARVILGQSTYLLQHQTGNYYVTESALKGKLWQHRVEYTLGSRRIQHYLTTLPDGRIVILPPTWDIARKQWIADVDTENPEEAPGGGFQVWNKSCYGCHVGREKKNFDLTGLQYHTTWQDFGVGCESCHGPGSEHVAITKEIAGMKYSSPRNDETKEGARLSAVPFWHYSSPGLAVGSSSRSSTNPTAQARVDPAQGGTTNSGPPSLVLEKLRDSIVNPARLDAARSTMICAQCHSYRDIYVDGFTAGANYYDFFVPVMEYRLPASADPAFWPDGRPRWISNEAFALWQSKCFLKGAATCLICHAQSHDIDVSRDSGLRAENKSICLACHAGIGANLTAHTHHLANSAGSSCIECHMPKTVLSLRTEIRDHTMSVPVPENTVRHQIPNACNLCHRDKAPQWAVEQMNSWYGDKSRQSYTRRADAFTDARKGDSAAVPELLAILSDPMQGPFIRANAAGYLGSFPNDPAAYDAVLHAFSDPEPLVRSTAVFAIRPRAAQRATVAPALVSLLRNPVRTVQMNAAIALVGMGVTQVPGEDGEWFEHAKQLYRKRAELNSDDARQQFAAGRFSLLSGDLEAAVSSFRAALKLDNTIPAKYYLADALAQKREFESARQILRTIPANDAQYAAAQQLLAQIEINAGQGQSRIVGGANETNSSGEAQFREGQSLYRNGNCGGALKSLEGALGVAPKAPWAARAQIYRAICLEKLGRAQEAEGVMRSLSESPSARDDADLQLAFVELLYDTGRLEQALKRIDEFLTAVPKAPMAHFWRGKVLLQLHRTDEAAKAAEESVRLLPDSPEPHNLLMRSYQMQGRTSDAMQQAEWLRQYQRRIESR